MFQVYHQKKAVNYSRAYSDDICYLLKDSEYNLLGFKGKRNGILLYESFINVIGSCNLIWKQ